MPKVINKSIFYQKQNFFFSDLVITTTQCAWKELKGDFSRV